MIWYLIEPWFGTAHHIRKLGLMWLVALTWMSIKCPYNWSLLRFRHAYILQMILHHELIWVLTQKTQPTPCSCWYYRMPRMRHWDCYIRMVQWMRLVAMSPNDHTNICLFNYSTTYPLNILIVGSLYRLDFSPFNGIFFQNLNVDIVFEYSILPWAHKSLVPNPHANLNMNIKST